MRGPSPGRPEGPLAEWQPPDLGDPGLGVGGGAHLLVDLLSGLCVTEGHSGQVLQDGHLHGAVSAIEQRHQGAGVQGAVHDLGADTCEDGRVIWWAGTVACPTLGDSAPPYPHPSGLGDPRAPSLLPGRTTKPRSRLGSPGLKDHRLLWSHGGRFWGKPRRPRGNICLGGRLRGTWVSVSNLKYSEQEPP